MCVSPNNGTAADHSGRSNGMRGGMLGFEMPQNTQNPQPGKHAFPFAPKPNPQQFLPLSDEDEPDEGGAEKRKVSPWQRMKWTDKMVRLLIMAVYYIGDEAGSEGPDPSSAPGGKKKPGGGLLQKKGKWKSVSRAMVVKGFCVSPQQCEDKFNDLNKRYKRVNDILGKGTACKVVENQSLLETMDHLSPKTKEEVRKLLNSKHLFFREMCAYHTSCSGGSARGGALGSTAAHPSPEQLQQQHHRCSPLPDNASGGFPNIKLAETQASKGSMEADDGYEDDADNDNDNEDDDEDEDDEVVEGFTRGHMSQGHDEEDENDGSNASKRPRKEMGQDPSEFPFAQQLRSEVANVLHDGARSAWEKRQWIKMQLMQVEEEQLRYQMEAFELEKQRLKWLKYSTKKEREMEMAKLKNERMRLENERMVLLLRKKEMELLDRQPNPLNNKRGSDPCSTTG